MLLIRKVLTALDSANWPISARARSSRAQTPIIALRMFWLDFQNRRHFGGRIAIRTVSRRTTQTTSTRAPAARTGNS
jgi:hypothetical protein